MKMQHVKLMEPFTIWLPKTMSCLLQSVRGTKDFDPELIVLALSGGELARAQKTWDFAPRWRFLRTVPMRRTVLL